MSLSYSRRISLILMLVVSLCLSPADGQQKVPKKGQPNPANRTIPASFETAPNGINGRVVDLDRTVAFSLTLDVDNQPKLEFKGIGKEAVVVSGDLSLQTKKLLAAEVDSLEGVVIRVAKNVKYSILTSTYETIKTAMKESKVSKPVYISVQEPKPRKQDEIRTQEFVCKNQKAADLYDRVYKVAKNFKVTVRLDPTRNSITAKGPSRSITLIQNMISYLDRPSGAPANSANSDIVPKKSASSNAVPKKTFDEGLPEKKVVGNPSIEPRIPRDQVPRDQVPRDQTSGSQPPVETIPSVSPTGSTVGRYQLSGVSNNLFLLDTATGEIWLLDPSRQPLSWIKLPNPKGNQ